MRFETFLDRQYPLDKVLITLLVHLKMAASEIAAQLSGCVLETPLEANCKLNVQGEIQEPMDLFADQRFLHHLQASGACCAALSEEQPDVIRFSREKFSPGPYIVAFDPLDGSSNVAVNIPVGSIFSIYKTAGNDQALTESDYLQRGDRQVAAGYYLYGSKTMLVFADAFGVNAFTLDTVTGEYLLSHPDIKIPPTGMTYAVNDGNYHLFRTGEQNYIRFCRQQADLKERPYTARYTGSMVADVHRLLIRGGVFLYPATRAAPKGKLRLAYECNPMAYIVEKAGGRAMSGDSSILSEPVTSIHQRSPIVLGSVHMVNMAERFINNLSLS